MFKIYCLINPLDNKPFYIGCSDKSMLEVWRRHKGLAKAICTKLEYPLVSERRRLITHLIEIKRPFAIRCIDIAHTVEEARALESERYNRYMEAGYTLLQQPSCFNYGYNRHKYKNRD